jgi:hypothetical protein
MRIPNSLFFHKERLKTFIQTTSLCELNHLPSRCILKWNYSCTLFQYPFATWQKKSWHPSFGYGYKVQQAILTMVVYFSKLTKFTTVLVHANHPSISIQGRSPISSHSQVHFEHYIPNVVACNVLSWTLHIIGYGMVLNTTHNAYVAPWRKWCIKDGDMCPKPTLPPTHMGWDRLGKWCHHMWRLEALAKKFHLGYVWVGLTCTPIIIVDGWVNLCYCSHCLA